MPKIYSSVGVYPNGDIKTNGVHENNILTHIGYNVFYRPGRALFIDGICVHKGSLSHEDIEKYRKMIGMTPEEFTFHKDTAPYH